MHFISRNSAFSHDKVIDLPCQRCLSSGGSTLIAHRSGFIDPLLDLVEVAPVGAVQVVGFFSGLVVGHRYLLKVQKLTLSIMMK
jgi:hypothetical protein